MFRPQISSVLQNIVNGNSYNIGHMNLFPHRLLLTNVSHKDSKITSSQSFCKDSDVTSSQNFPKDSNITSSESFNKHSANAAPHSEQYARRESVKFSDIFKIPLKTSDAITLSDPQTSTEAEPDKLYKKLEIEVRGNDPAVLQSYGEYAVMAAKHLDIIVGRNVALRKPIHERLTVLKSVHVHKKHRVQYETRTYYRYLDFFKVTGSTADTYLEYIQRNLPEGVAMKVTKVELQTLPDTVQQVALPEK